MIDIIVVIFVIKIILVINLYGITTENFIIIMFPIIFQLFPIIFQLFPIVSNNIPIVSNNKNTCKYCYKVYSSPQNRWKHEQKCKKVKIIDDKVKNLEDTILQLQQQIQHIVNEKGKIHHKTLHKINKQITNTINNTNNNNTNNGTIINNTFVKFGDVSYDKIFNEKQLLSILNKQYMSIEEGITKTHFNQNLPQYSNVFITNFKDPLAYIFNGKAFITVKNTIC